MRSMNYPACVLGPVSPISGGMVLATSICKNVGAIRVLHGRADRVLEFLAFAHIASAAAVALGQCNRVDTEGRSMPGNPGAFEVLSKRFQDGVLVIPHDDVQDGELCLGCVPERLNDVLRCAVTLDANDLAMRPKLPFGHRDTDSRRQAVAEHTPLNMEKNDRGAEVGGYAA